MSRYFAFTGKPKPLNIPSLGPDRTFLIRDLTQADYEQVGVELFRHNIVPMSQESFRAHFINEIYEIYEEAAAEEKANLLDVYWQAEDIYNEAVARWSEQEEQRILDMQFGAPKREPAPRPEHTMHVRERARATALADDVRRQSRKLRDINIEMNTYALRQKEGMVRVVLVGWSGFETEFAQDDTLTITTDEAWEALKREIGQEAVGTLMKSVMAGEYVDPTERGNSDSPPVTTPGLTGSPEQSDASEPSAGTSTESSTSPAQPDASEATTKPLSVYTGPFGGNTLSTGGRPMGGK